MGALAVYSNPEVEGTTTLQNTNVLFRTDVVGHALSKVIDTARVAYDRYRATAAWLDNRVGRSHFACATVLAIRADRTLCRLAVRSAVVANSIEILQRTAVSAVCLRRKATAAVDTVGAVLARGKQSVRTAVFAYTV